MRPLTAAAFCMLSVGLAFPSPARADNPTSPPAPPAAQTSPEAESDSPAPQQHRHHMRPAFVLSDLTVKLDLTPDEQKKVGAFIDDGAAQTKKIRADETLSKEDKRSKVSGINMATRDQIRLVLTPAQQKQFEALPGPGKPRLPATDSKLPPSDSKPAAAAPKPPASN